MEEERAKKKPLDIQWNKVLPDDDDDVDPPEVLIKNDKPNTTDEPPKQSAMGVHQRPDDQFADYTDDMLREAIERFLRTVVTMGPTLSDKGERLRVRLKQMEEEMERRKRRRLETDTSKCEKLTQAMSSRNIGASNGFREEPTTPPYKPQSSFASIFNQRMEGNRDCRATNAFEKETSSLGRCDRQNMKSNGELLQKGGQKGRSSSRHLPFQSPSTFSRKRDKCNLSNGDHKGRVPSTYSHRELRSLSSCITKKKDASQVQNENAKRPRKGTTIVLVDEEEPQIMDTTEQVEELPECMKEAKIYYPSRDDPEAVEICSADIKCLNPGTYLASTIMNFYIRYLQQQASPTDGAICNYHFFNTFFYQKLKEAVEYKGSNKDDFFLKFRRWWKGVNIFQKPYVLIPIHEDQHWSLVIICNPDKEEEESGPIVLHLDSLGLHSSRLIFHNIKSYLKEEWHYCVDKEVAFSDPPVSDSLWKKLPHKIEEKKLVVPQQRNEYDCGVFVLFFMERFIEDTPKRLKKKDLVMFGKQWFKPEEASSLRMKIRKLLWEEFENVCQVRT